MRSLVMRISLLVTDANPSRLRKLFTYPIVSDVIPITITTVLTPRKMLFRGFLRIRSPHGKQRSDLLVISDSHGVFTHMISFFNQSYMICLFCWVLTHSHLDHPVAHSTVYLEIDSLHSLGYLHPS
jgi:hypothetical protein